MKNNYFVLAGDNKLEKVDGVHFLFPLKSYCVGMKKYYELEEVPDNSYLYINRILDEEAIEKLESILDKIEKKCKGIVFEDLGILELLNSVKSPLKKILFAPHMVCSLPTSKAFLKEADYVFLATDITLEENEKILKNSPCCGVYVYGHLPFMYSRRTLLKNYANNFDLKEENHLLIEENISSKRFFAVENEYGTVLYDSRVYDGRELLGKANFYLISLEFEKVKSISDFIKDFEALKEFEDTTTGFLHQKTIYKLPPKKGESS